MSRPKIAIDIDSTLYDFSPPTRQAFFDLGLEKNDKRGYFPGGYQTWVEWRSAEDACGLRPFLEVLDRVHSDEVILSRRPFEDAVTVINELAEHCDILYVTHRKPESYGATDEWLDRWGFFRTWNENDDGHTDLIISNADKNLVLGQCQYLIDDRPKTLVEFVYDFTWKYSHGSANGSTKRKGFSLLYEYNRGLTDIPDIFLAPTWLGLSHYLREEGVMNDARELAANQG